MSKTSSKTKFRYKHDLEEFPSLVRDFLSLFYSKIKETCSFWQIIKMFLDFRLSSILFREFYCRVLCISQSTDKYNNYYLTKLKQVKGFPLLHSLFVKHYIFSFHKSILFCEHMSSNRKISMIELQIFSIKACN